MMSSRMPEWYKVMILCPQLSGIAKTADCFPGVLLSLHNSESSSKYLTANFLVLLIAVL